MKRILVGMTTVWFSYACGFHTTDNYMIETTLINRTHVG